MKNDSDLTAQWTVNFDWRFEFQEHYDSGLGESTGIYIYGHNNNEIAVGGWCFDSDDPDGIAADVTEMLFGFYLIDQDYLVSGIYPLITRTGCKYDILRLKNDELWLEHTDSVQNVYTIQFSSN